MKRQFVIGGLILLGAILIAALMIMSRSEPPEKPKEELVPLVQAEPLEIRSGNLLVGGAGTVYNSLDNSHSLNVLIQETASDVSSSYSSSSGEQELYGYTELS